CLKDVDQDGNIDFTRTGTHKMVDIYTKASGANGDLSVLADALKDYSNGPGGAGNVGGHMYPETFDALNAAAGRPRGAEVLKEKIGAISGWGWGVPRGGADLSDQGVKNLLDAYRTPVEKGSPSVQARGAKLDDFTQKLRQAGADVPEARVKEIAVQ